MKKITILIIAIMLLLAVLIYWVDYALDHNHVDCFDNKVNHVLISFASIILIAVVVLCFVLFYSTKREK
ncbi:MAG: hypothetical protein Q7W13_00255 [Bacteroidia bacterium]|nr:hypothetical protein [Bacteroidia bacterium]